MEFIGVIKDLPLRTDARVLDINNSLNSNESLLLDLFPNGHLITINKNRDKIKTIIKSIEDKKIKNIHDKYSAFHFEYDNGNKLPLKDNSVDLVILSGVLRDVVYRESLLKDIARVLCRGGFIFVTELYENAHGVETHPDSRILLDDMLEYLDTAGFIFHKNFDKNSDVYGIIGICSLV
jgi:ubiquinone/menaquinone biosynthesis C-methylase UbiE